MIDIDMAKQILQGDDTHPDILQASGLEMLAEVKRLRKLRDEITNLIRIDEINSKCCICGKAIQVPEGELWTDGCWECYFEGEEQ